MVLSISYVRNTTTVVADRTTNCSNVNEKSGVFYLLSILDWLPDQSLDDEQDHLIDQPALTWVLGFPLVPSEQFSFGFDPSQDKRGQELALSSPSQPLVAQTTQCPNAISATGYGPAHQCWRPCPWFGMLTNRHELDRDSVEYKELYAERTAVERINSQAVALGIERPHLRNQASITNQNTLIYVLINPYEGKLTRPHARQGEKGADATQLLVPLLTSSA